MKIQVLLYCLILTGVAQAQDVQMADALRSDGKIYVVISTILLIFLGLMIYLIRLDAKVKQWEKK